LQRVTRSFEGAQLAETPDRRPVILTRTGSAGSQSHHAAVWTAGSGLCSEALAKEGDPALHPTIS
jgi:hypothetical protein